MIAHGMTPIRYCSDLNEWMDCVIFVPDKNAKLAEYAVRAGISSYWVGEYDTFGEAIEDALERYDIPFVIQYLPWDDVYDCPDESYLVWEEWIEEIWSTTPGVTIN